MTQTLLIYRFYSLAWLVDLRKKYANEEIKAQGAVNRVDLLVVLVFLS